MTKLPDFPYYSGRPILLEGRAWLILMAALAFAFAALSLIPLQGFPQNLIPALLFLFIPLLALRWVAGPYWTALFRKVGLRQVAQMPDGRSYLWIARMVRHRRGGFGVELEGDRLSKASGSDVNEGGVKLTFNGFNRRSAKKRER